MNVTQPLSSNNELRKEVSNERSRTNRSLWNVSGKKMPFHVHCDDANKISHVCDSQAETHRISNMTSVDSIESHSKRSENLKQVNKIKFFIAFVRTVYSFIIFFFFLDGIEQNNAKTILARMPAHDRISSV